MDLTNGYYNLGSALFITETGENINFRIIAHVWTYAIMQEINNINSKKIKMHSCIRLIVK
jgi:hypothetical protein